MAWLAQGLTSVGVAVIVWVVWRSTARYSLKAAVLSAASLLATPYAFAYDIAAIAVPVAFLARDQIRHGFLWAEQSIAIVLFTLTFAVLLAFGDRQGGVTFGNVPLGPFVLVALLALVLRRVADEDMRPDYEPNFKGFETPAK